MTRFQPYRGRHPNIGKLVMIFSRIRGGTGQIEVPCQNDTVVEFLVEYSTVEIRFTVASYLCKSGGNRPFRTIIRDVIRVCRKVIPILREGGVRQVYFSASSYEEARCRLYHRLARLIENSLPGAKAKEAGHGSFIIDL